MCNVEEVEQNIKIHLFKVNIVRYMIILSNQDRKIRFLIQKILHPAFFLHWKSSASEKKYWWFLPTSQDFIREPGNLHLIFTGIIRIALKDILPALGTHSPMTDNQIDEMFKEVPRSLFRVHDWRKDVVTVGTVPGEFVSDITAGL